MAAIVGSEGLAPGDRRALDFVDAFEGSSSIKEPCGAPCTTRCEIGWSLLETLPRDELTRISDATWDAHVDAAPGRSSRMTASLRPTNAVGPGPRERAARPRPQRPRAAEPQA